MNTAADNRYLDPTYHAGRTDASLPEPSLDSPGLDALCATLLLGEEDLGHLRRSGPILEPQIDAVLDTWYGFVGSTPHLLHYFSTPQGEVLPRYLEAVRARFGQWIRDTAAANYDGEWLAYQQEIGRRHHRIGKNTTDGAAAVPHIPFRYLVALTVPIVLTLRPFLAKAGHSTQDVDAMQHAWLKSVLLQVILWSHPYVHEGQF